VVVRLLAKEKVVGSNPIARLTVEIWRRGQVVRQGSAKPSSRVRIPSTPLNMDGVRLLTDAFGRLFILNSFIISLSLMEFIFVL
jgi:hypothetical protein